MKTAALNSAARDMGLIDDKSHQFANHIESKTEWWSGLIITDVSGGCPTLLRAAPELIGRHLTKEALTKINQGPWLIDIHVKGQRVIASRLLGSGQGQMPQ
jgi:hypothetical protein